MLQNEDASKLKKEPSKRSKSAVLPLLLAGVFMVTGICVLLLIGREKARIIGQTITELDIQPLLNAEKPIADDDMKSKVVVLHFWGFWCQEFAKEMPDFVKTQRSFRDDTSVLFASIACSNQSQDTSDSLKFYTHKFLQNIDADDLPIYCDPAEFSRTRISQLMTVGGFSYPTTMVMDGEGKVVDVWRTSVPLNALTKAIEKAKLASRAPL